MDAIRALDERFEAAEFRELRRRAASHLLNPRDDDVEGEEATVALLNFFESVGFLYANHVIGDRIVWHFFSAWLLPYYNAALELIVAPRRQKDPNSFCELQRVYKAVKKIEESRHPSGDTLHLLTPTAVQAFLEKEAKLASRTLPSTAPA